MDFYEERDGPPDLLWSHALFHKRGSKRGGDFREQNSNKMICMSRESKWFGLNDGYGSGNSGQDGRIKTEG